MAKEGNRNNTLLFLIIFLLTGSTIIKAQVSGMAGYSAFADDNPQRTSEGTSEFINTYLAELNLQLFNRDLYLTYSGGYSAYTKLDSMSFQLHSFELSYAFSTSADSIEDSQNIYTSLSYSLKRGKDDYAVYDYSQVNAFINGRFPLAETFFISSGLYSTYKSFPSLNSLTHFENVISLQLSKFFNSGTGIFMDNSLGSMNYSYTQEGTGSSGHGSGRRKSSNSSGMDISYNVIQLRNGIRISQSVFENTGMAARYLHRENLKDNKGMYLSSAYIYSGDDELWDDSYGFSGNEFCVKLTQNLPYDIIIKAGADYSSRHYTNNAADSLNISERRDEKIVFTAGMSKTFYELPLLSSLEVTVEYMFINNKSNQLLFAYKNNLFMIGVQAGF